MFFVLSKLLGVVFQPVNLLLILLTVGAVFLLAGWPRAGRALLVGTTVAFLVCGVLPFGTALLRVLEDRFPPPPRDMAAPTGIIVLGGALDEEVSFARGAFSMSQAGSRMTTGAALALRYPQARLVFTGGTNDLQQVGRDEAEGARRLWVSLGVPETRMSFESKSRNTFENALFTRDLVRPQPGETWLLVTSAWHMPRSMGIFRRAGFPVTAYPTDYRTLGTARDWQLSTNALDALDRVDTGLHEWIGLVAYAVTDKTDALFPKP